MYSRYYVRVNRAKAIYNAMLADVCKDDVILKDNGWSHYPLEYGSSVDIAPVVCGLHNAMAAIVDKNRIRVVDVCYSEETDYAVVSITRKTR